VPKEPGVTGRRREPGSVQLAASEEGRDGGKAGMGERVWPGKLVPEGGKLNFFSLKKIKKLLCSGGLC